MSGFTSLIYIPYFVKKELLKLVNEDLYLTFGNKERIKDYLEIRGREWDDISYYKEMYEELREKLVAENFNFTLLEMSELVYLIDIIMDKEQMKVDSLQKTLDNLKKKIKN